MQRGQKVGEYVLEEPLGRGGFAEVWLGRHSVLPGKRAAIKIPTDPTYVEYLRREGVAQHDLEHPNIVTVLGADVSGEVPYLAMEYMSGGSLRRRLSEKGRLSAEEARSVVGDVLRALEHAHARGVVHCDIKPENILLDAGGRAGLSDFGLWRFKSSLAEKGDLSVSFISDGGPTRGGTLLYMSPEQQRGEPADPRDDLYSVSVVLFESLTGGLPAPGDRISDFVTAPNWAQRLFERCFVRRDRRLSDATQALRIIGDAQDERREASAADAAADAAPPRARAKMPFGGGAGKADEVAPKQGGCFPLLAMLLGAALGFLIFWRFGGLLPAVCGGGAGVIFGAHLTRPLASVIVVGCGVGGGLLRGPAGALVGAVLGMLLVFVLLSDNREDKGRA